MSLYFWLYIVFSSYCICFHNGFITVVLRCFTSTFFLKTVLYHLDFCFILLRYQVSLCLILVSINSLYLISVSSLSFLLHNHEIFSSSSSSFFQLSPPTFIYCSFIPALQLHSIISFNFVPPE